MTATTLKPFKTQQEIWEYLLSGGKITFCGWQPWSSDSYLHLVDGEPTTNDDTCIKYAFNAKFWKPWVPQPKVFNSLFEAIPFMQAGGVVENSSGFRYRTSEGRIQISPKGLDFYDMCAVIHHLTDRVTEVVS